LQPVVVEGTEEAAPLAAAPLVEELVVKDVTQPSATDDFSANEAAEMATFTSECGGGVSLEDIQTQMKEIEKGLVLLSKQQNFIIEKLNLNTAPASSS